MSLIEKLRALHTVDSQVRGIRTRFDNAERDLKRHQQQLDTLAGKRRDLEAQARQLPHESCAGACGRRCQMGIHRDDRHPNGVGQGRFAR